MENAGATEDGGEEREQLEERTDTKDDFTGVLFIRGPGELSQDERKEIFRSVAKGAGIENEIEYTGSFNQKAWDPGLFIALGAFAVSSIDALLTYLNYVESREEVQPALIKTHDGDSIEARDVSRDVIINNGGTVLGKLDNGKVVFQSETTNFELNKALREESGSLQNTVSDKMDELQEE